MTKKERYQNVLNYFLEHVPVAETELHYTNPYELIVAVVLSAQCTDKRVNMVTPKLFDAFPNAESLAASNSDTVFNYIRSISYPNNKAKHLVGLANMLLKDFNGIVPEKVDELVKLPGVGRKTANVTNVTSTNNTFASVNVEDLNGAVVDAGLTPNGTSHIDFEFKDPASNQIQRRPAARGHVIATRITSE